MRSEFYLDRPVVLAGSFVVELNPDPFPSGEARLPHEAHDSLASAYSNCSM
jgi:hypothetical protein